MSTSARAGRWGIREGAARRYLRLPAEAGAVDYTLRSGAAGRPEHLYRWTAAATHG